MVDDSTFAVPPVEEAKEHLNAILDDLPRSVPTNQIMFGRRNAALTLGDLYSLAGRKPEPEVQKQVPGVSNLHVEEGHAHPSHSPPEPPKVAKK